MVFDLVVVMPVYNEQDCVVEVIESWIQTLDHLRIEYKIQVLNDGSKDGTKDALSIYNRHKRVEVIHKPNSGHGPTILMGYHNAVKEAEWVFQCDSDNEMKAQYFPELWEKRENFDALFGFRSGRHQSMGRRFVTMCSYWTVRLLFGKGIKDVNVPYRLIRSSILKQIIDQIPGNTFIPNIIITGVLIRAGSKYYNHPIPHENRKTGTSSIIKWKLLRAVFISFYQTIYCRPKI